MTSTAVRPVSFSASKEDFALVALVVERAMKMYVELDIDGPTRSDLTMDLIAAHANGCQMDWQKLLDADRSNFSHDIGGIRRHLDRSTGELKNCFAPRYALR